VRITLREHLQKHLTAPAAKLQLEVSHQRRTLRLIYLEELREDETTFAQKLDGVNPATSGEFVNKC